VKPPHRRQFLHLAAGAAALPAVSRIASAQTYPSRPVRIIVGFGAGGLADIAARMIAQWLSERLGQPFLVENRSGAGTNIAAEAVVRSAPDGYTLLLATSSNAINATLYETLSFNFIRDIAPIATICSTPSVLVVHPSLPAKTVPDLIAYAKANPGKINMAAVGIGSTSHVFGELFKIMAGVDLVTVQYRDPGPAHTDLISKQVDIMFDPLIGSIEQIRAGQLRGLAVTAMTRSETLPDVPTLSDFVPGYEASTWVGVSAPRNISADIVDKLNGNINGALADTKIKTRLADLGATTIPGFARRLSKIHCRRYREVGQGSQNRGDQGGVGPIPPQGLGVIIPVLSGGGPLKLCPPFRRSYVPFCRERTLGRRTSLWHCPGQYGHPARRLRSAISRAIASLPSFNSRSRYSRSRS
jgi:tripartite-type tricarboxylate transporter receptor subunit TctC